MRLWWYCGMNADVGDFGTEPTECTGVGVITLSADQEQDWEDELTPCITCTQCGQVLEDPSHYTDHSSVGQTPAPAPILWEPPLPEHWFEEGDHCLYEGGVWRVVRHQLDEFDPREQKVHIEYVAGPRMGSMLYATGIRTSDLTPLTDMEVLAYSSQEKQG